MYANTVNTEITKTERNKVPRGENVHQSMDSMKEKTPEEAERGSVLRMSMSLKKVARRPGSERMWPPRTWEA
jgi:hypothetical protein